ncbi:MAG: phosphatase PAP2 family protein [Asgard group archaeon]|nr:phosphatase PAP2 family protein [Asgard group archaeon]
MSWFFDQAINEWLQNLFPEWFKYIFIIITYLGNAIIYISLLAIAYWIYRKKDAIIGIYILLTSTFLNFFLKVLIGKPRPDASIRLVSEEGFSTPSNHAQTSTTVYGWMTFHFKKLWLYIVTPIMIILICFSRVYLGVHFIGDVIIGLLIGAAFLTACIFAVPPLVKWIDSWKTWVKIVVGESYGVVIFLLTYLTGMYAEWPTGDTSNSADIVAALILFPVLIWIESKWVKMKTENIHWHSKLLRVIVGLVVLVGMYFGLSELFDLITLSSLSGNGLYTVEYLLRFIRYGILIIILGLLMPLLFAKVKIFSKEKEVIQDKTQEQAVSS